MSEDLSLKEEMKRLAKHGSIPELVAFTQNWNSVDIHDKSNSSLLHWAAYAGRLEVVRHLVNAGANANRCDSDGVTPLMYAMVSPLSKEKYDLIHFLIEEGGADPDGKDSKGRTALHWALALTNGSDFNIIEYLVNKVGMNASMADIYGHTPLVFAFSNTIASLRIAKLLIKAGADVNCRDIEGKTALHEAVERNSIALVKLILKSGADVNACDVEHKTPLHYATEAYNIVLLLPDSENIDEIRHGEQIEFVETGESPIMEMLVNAGGNIDAKDNNGDSPREIWAYKFKHKSGKR